MQESGNYRPPPRDTEQDVAPAIARKPTFPHAAGLADAVPAQPVSAGQWALLYFRPTGRWPGSLPDTQAVTLSQVIFLAEISDGTGRCGGLCVPHAFPVRVAASRAVGRLSLRRRWPGAWSEGAVRRRWKPSLAFERGWCVNCLTNNQACQLCRLREAEMCIISFSADVPCLPPPSAGFLCCSPFPLQANSLQPLTELLPGLTCHIPTIMGLTPGMLAG